MITKISFIWFLRSLCISVFHNHKASQVRVEKPFQNVDFVSHIRLKWWEEYLLKKKKT